MTAVYSVHKSETREKILDAAGRIVRKEGADSLSVRRVAAEVRLTAMAIYRHFRSKDDLIAALVAIGFDSWEARLGRAIAGVAPGQRLRSAMLAYRDFALQEQRLFELMFLTPRRGVPPAPASLQTSPSPAFSLVIAAVEKSLSQGSLVPGDAGETILLVWSAAHGLITLHFSGRFGHDDKRFRKIFERTMDQLLGVLTPRLESRQRRRVPGQPTGVLD